MKSQTLILAVVLNLVDYAPGQLDINETLHNDSYCDLNDAVSVNCGSTAVIAIYQVQYGYNVSCTSSCCQYDTKDCLVVATNKEDIKRICSGRASCVVPVLKTQNFCSFGTIAASYVYIEYYCISSDRLRFINSVLSVSSEGQPIYLINPGYPGVTIQTGVFACSFEVESCSSVTKVIIFDVDLYRSINDCKQSLNISDSSNSTLDTIACENYYDTFVTEKEFSSHYLKISFQSSSTANLEGYFFIGISASEPNVRVNLSCQFERSSWCPDCLAPSNIQHGNVTLTNPGELTYNSSATVSCDSGYVANARTILCKDQGVWQSASCTPKPTCSGSQWTCTSDKSCISNSTRCDNFPDCDDKSDEYNCTGTELCLEGQVSCQQSNGSRYCTTSVCDCGRPDVLYGSALLDNQTISTSGSTATVTCMSGYTPSASNITCQSNGLWENVSCKGNDCGIPPAISNGNISLVQSGNTTYGATATVTCLLGFQPTVSTIQCLVTGLWSAVSCLIASTTLASTDSTVSTAPNDNNTTTIVLAVVLSCLALLLLLWQYVLYCKLASGDNNLIDKRGLIPIFGWYFLLPKLCFVFKHYQVENGKKANQGFSNGKYSSTIDFTQHFSNDKKGSEMVHPGDIEIEEHPYISFDRTDDMPIQTKISGHISPSGDHVYDVPSTHTEMTGLDHETGSTAASSVHSFNVDHNLMTRGISAVAVTTSSGNLAGVENPKQVHTDKQKHDHTDSHGKRLSINPQNHSTMYDNFTPAGNNPHIRAHERLEHQSNLTGQHAHFY